MLLKNLNHKYALRNIYLKKIVQHFKNLCFKNTTNWLYITCEHK